MVWNKQNIEKIIFSTVILFLVINAFINHDSVFALISAVCAITYTFFAGKGKPLCYLYGVCGSGFYSLISFQSALWGNLALYLFYYIPMQILGFFKWNNNLKTDKNEIVKIKLPKKDLIILLVISLILIIITSLILIILNDKHPYLDSITTILSLGGMYLTVRRAIEQWIFWIIVNALSLLMWLNVALSGVKVWSTVIMWAVYLILAFYFYIEWQKELKTDIGA